MIKDWTLITYIAMVVGFFWVASAYSAWVIRVSVRSKRLPNSVDVYNILLSLSLCYRSALSAYIRYWRFEDYNYYNSFLDSEIWSTRSIPAIVLVFMLGWRVTRRAVLSEIFAKKVIKERWGRRKDDRNSL